MANRHAPSSCQCKFGYYETSSKKCEKCVYPCNSCITRADNCLSCGWGPSTRDTPTCDCKIDYYALNRDCHKCHFRCASCV